MATGSDTKARCLKTILPIHRDLERSGKTACRPRRPPKQAKTVALAAWLCHKHHFGQNGLYAKGASAGLRALEIV
jgi:hypothetical protein